MKRQGKIHWLKMEERGRKSPPEVETYYATTYISQLLQYWSIKVYLLQPGEYISDCEVAFLVDKAPNNILNSVEELDVYEGAQKVATICFMERN